MIDKERLNELAETFSRLAANRDWEVSVIANRIDREPLVYQAPQLVLVPEFEYRAREDGDSYWVAKLPFFGFFAYGATPEAASERVIQMLTIIAESHRTYALSQLERDA